MKIEDIDFILSHFQDQIQLFPRKMMTLSKSWQFSVSSIEEVYQECKKSNFVDCRINAYAEYTEYKGIIRQPPNFIFIDLDLANFEMDRKKLDLRLNKTLNKIEEYDGFPTVLWTGNGYHIYLPISAIVLDQESIFSKERFPNLFSASGKYSNWSISEVFLKYAEIFFTNGKADPLHKPKYKTCLIRIPDSYNSKLLFNRCSREESLVKIVQTWNGYHPPIQLFLKEFRRWLVQEEINQKIQNRKIRNIQSIKSGNTNNFQIPWIERLLQIGIQDGRKETLRLILGPYISKRNTYDRSISILQNWIEKCDKVYPLDPGFNSRQRISNSVKNTKGFLNLENLRIKYPSLYFTIQKEINVNKL
ncbi:MAG: hypothetical protein R2685_11985 [Candidatus Nitrosocosmicus sp.]|nr:hypothetical protein [Candidatus Nitrosocosmicus sp.]